MKLSIRGKHGNHNIKKYRRTTYRRNNRNKRTQYVSHGGSTVLPIDIECVASTNIFQTELSYKNTLKWYTKPTKSNFNITFAKQTLNERQNTLNFELIMERIHKKTDVVDKIFTIYFTVEYFENNTTNIPCNSCYEIYYSQDSNAGSKALLYTIFHLNAVCKKKIDNTFIVTNDKIGDKPVCTYTFECNNNTNKNFFAYLVNQISICIIRKRADNKGEQPHQTPNTC
jgi:hypothetical protein